MDPNRIGVIDKEGGCMARGGRREIFIIFNPGDALLKERLSSFLHHSQSLHSYQVINKYCTILTDHQTKA